MNKNIKVICTIGPATFQKRKLKELKKLKVDLFRINLSHTQITDLPKRIKELKNSKIKNICIDVEGAQVRTTTLKKKFLKIDQIVTFNKKLKNNVKNIGLYPDFNFNKLKKNDHIFIGFENLKLKVNKVKKDIIKTKVINEGYVESNKGVHFNRNVKLKALTQKDIESIIIAKSLNVKNFALSFANNKKDVLEFRKLIGKKSNLISKIETMQALKNLDDIINYSNEILIDRGDLSRYIPIEKIPIAQMHILKKSILKKTKCLVATNLLETMVVNKEPTRAESNDIFSTLDKGADGLVLAAETAVGKYPIECVKFIKKCIQSYKLYQKNIKSKKKDYI